MIRNGREVLPGAVFSPSNCHRYVLTRDWSADLLTGSKSTVLFIMLNPSRADALKDDPTIRRCVDYAMLWGYSRLVVCNLFSYRATLPQVMKDNGRASIGEANDSHILEQADAADRVIVAWGKHGKFMLRDIEVLRLITGSCEPYCLGLNKDGSPVHPLRQPKDAHPFPMSL